MTFNQQLIDYLAFYPETATIAVPQDRVAEAGTVPGVSVVGQDATYCEYRDAAGEVLARVVFSE